MKLLRFTLLDKRDPLMERQLAVKKVLLIIAISLQVKVNPPVNTG
jgi:hypothetical protein